MSDQLFIGGINVLLALIALVFWAAAAFVLIEQRSRPSARRRPAPRCKARKKANFWLLRFWRWVKAHWPKRAKRHGARRPPVPPVNTGGKGKSVVGQVAAVLGLLFFMNVSFSAFLLTVYFAVVFQFRGVFEIAITLGAALLFLALLGVLALLIRYLIKK